jgi:hypothetical protein
MTNRNKYPGKMYIAFILRFKSISHHVEVTVLAQPLSHTFTSEMLSTLISICIFKQLYRNAISLAAATTLKQREPESRKNRTQTRENSGVVFVKIPLPLDFILENPQLNPISSA